LPYQDIYINKGKLSPFKDDTIPNVTFTYSALFSDSSGPCNKRAPSIAMERNNANNVYVAWEDNRTATSSCSADYTIRAAVGPPPKNPPPNPLPAQNPPTSYPILSAIYLGSGSQTEPSIGVFQSNRTLPDRRSVFCTGICFTKGKTPTSSRDLFWSTTGPILAADDTGAADPHSPKPCCGFHRGQSEYGNVYVAWQDNRNGSNYNIFLPRRKKDETF
jgi:hypothetical protein